MTDPEIYNKMFAVFPGITPEDVSRLAAVCTEEEYQAGELICDAGTEITDFSFIANGTVRVVSEKNPANSLLIDTLQINSSFGKEFIHAFNHHKFSYYADCPKTELISINANDLTKVFLEFPETEARIISGIVKFSLSEFINLSSVNTTLPMEAIEEAVKESTRLKLSQGEVLPNATKDSSDIFYVYKGVFKSLSDHKRGGAVKFHSGGEILGSIMDGIGTPLTTTLTAETFVEVICIPKLELMLSLFEQSEFAASLDTIIESKIEKPKPEESKKEEEAKPEEAAPKSGYIYKKPLKYSLNRFPTVRQHSQMDCGAAAVATVCRYYGKRVNLNKMRELTRVGQQGASMYHIMTALNELGFEIDPMLSTYDDLKKESLPAIVNWKGYHWIVVNKMTADKVWVSDPGQGCKIYSKEDFIAGWTRYALYIYPTERIETIEEEIPSLRQFKTYFTPYKKYIWEIALASLGLQVLNLFYPIFSKFIVDNVIMKDNRDMLFVSVLVILMVVAFSSTMSFVRQRLILYVSMKANIRLASDFLKHILNLPISFFESRKVGDITTRFMENEKITNFFTSTGIQVFLDMLTAVLYLGLMYYYNFSLTFVVFLFIVCQIFIFKIITPKLLHSFREVFQHQAASESYLIESLKGISTVKTLGIENQTRWKWENLQIKAINGFFKSIKYMIYSTLSVGVITNLSEAAVLFYGAYLVLTSRLSVGELIAFTIMAKAVSAPIMSLMSSWNTFQEAVNSVERINDVLESPLEIKEHDENEKISVRQIRGFIKLDNVTFRYHSDSKDNVIENVSIEIKAGERVAFVGRSGSGKSTLSKLLYGFYAPSSGRVFIDGFDLADLYLPHIRAQIGMVPQESDLFRGTIRENIAKGKPDVQLSEIIEVAKLANAHNFISEMPLGYDAHLEERGSNISGGQRQRIAIARTFLMKPKILILDEATSALDNETEKNIQYNVENNFKESTVLMIAHRLSTIKKADKIIVIDKGNIVEAGNHAELMENRGLYYYLSTQQLSL